MPQLFKPGANELARVTILASVIGAVVVLGVVLLMSRTPFVTQQGVIKEQPVMFSHEHHVNGLGIDCRFCHTSVEKSSYAGIPATQTCMTCHSQIWRESPMLEPVRQSFQTGRPIAWVRIHDLPDFVYFDHSIHVNKGVACVTCHGPIQKMSLTYQAQPLTMEWCIGCHRSPEKNVRPREDVFKTDWAGPKSEVERIQLAQSLKQKYEIKSLTDCTVCHR